MFWIKYVSTLLRPTMEMADFWLVDKPAIHKLFKASLSFSWAETEKSRPYIFTFLFYLCPFLLLGVGSKIERRATCLYPIFQCSNAGRWSKLELFLQHISVAGERRYDTRSSSRSRKYSCCRRPVQGQMCSWNCKCLHFCCLLNNPWLDWYRWGIRFPRWPTATAKQTRRWSTMFCSVRLGESTGLPRRLLEVRTWAKGGKRRKRLIDRAAFNILCLSIMISVKKQKWYLEMFQTPMEGATSELEIDSELVMSFYDQYQVPYLPCTCHENWHHKNSMFMKNMCRQTILLVRSTEWTQAWPAWTTRTVEGQVKNI